VTEATLTIIEEEKMKYEGTRIMIDYYLEIKNNRREKEIR